MDAVALSGSVVACAVMAGAAVLTGWRVDAVSRRGGGADDYFWTMFGGVVVLVGAGVTAAILGAAWIAGTVGVVSSAAAGIWVWRLHGRRALLAEETARTAVWSELHGRHDAVVRRWADYELDPAKAISYPGMHDPGNPAIRPVTRALRAADAERDAGTATTAQGPVLQRYADAVTRLERALDAAECDPAALGTQRLPRHRGAPGRL